MGEEFARLRRLMEARLSQKNRRAAGKRDSFSAAALQIFPDGVVRAAVHDALELGAISADAVKHLRFAEWSAAPHDST